MSREKYPRLEDLSEDEVDEIAIAQADDDSAWEAPIEVKRNKSASLSIAPELAARAAFLARLHRAQVEEWLTRVIRERIEIEETAFAEAKREIQKQG